MEEFCENAEYNTVMWLESFVSAQVPILNWAQHARGALRLIDFLRLKEMFNLTKPITVTLFFITFGSFAKEHNDKCS